MSDNSSGKGWNPFGSVITILGILMGTALLISLIQRWTGVEIISETARDALSLYRQMMEQIHWALFDWWTPVALPWGWTLVMPLWVLDAAFLWLLAGFAAARGHMAYIYEVEARNGKRLEHLRKSHIYDAKRNLLRGPFGLWNYLSDCLHAIQVATGLHSVKLDWSARERWISIRHTLVGMVGAILPLILTPLFFFWNAIQLTPQ